MIAVSTERRTRLMEPNLALRWNGRVRFIVPRDAARP
jgi:hypothetical protein